MASKELLTRRIEEAEKKLFEMERYGEDSFEIGSIIQFDKQFAKGDTVYSYVAIKFSESMWSISGHTNGSFKTWDELVEFFLHIVPVEDVWYVTALEKIT